MRKNISNSRLITQYTYAEITQMVLLYYRAFNTEVGEY